MHLNIFIIIFKIIIIICILYMKDNVDNVKEKMIEECLGL